ncbi:MAG: SpoIIE family protein phosphatase [Terracidiphilus sp.]
MRLAFALRRFTPIAALLCAAWLYAALLPATGRAQTFDLDRGREPLVSLDGPWRFHPGDSPIDPGSHTPLWASPSFVDSNWPLLRSDKSWDAQGYQGMSGFGWYRFTVHIPAGPTATSLLLAPILTAFEVYIDGTRVGGSGQMPPALVPSTEIRFHLFPLTFAGSPNPRTVQVAIRVWHCPMWASYVGGGPYLGGHLAGDPALLAVEQQHLQIARNVRFVDGYSYSITAALVGLAILCLFLIRHAEIEYLWFALILLSQAADNALNVAQSVYFLLPIPVNDLLDGIFTAITIISALFFFSRVLGAHTRWSGRAVLILAVISPLAVISYLPGWASVPAAGALQLACLLPAVLWILTLLVVWALRGNLDARLLLLPTFLDFGYYLADNLAIVLNQAGWFSFPHILELPLPLPPFTMQTGILLHLVFLLAMVIFLILRFTRARRREAFLAGEFEAARQIQQLLLPDASDQCPGFSVEYIYQPAEELGGDFFQQIGDGHGGLLLVVGDVSGKGLPAAMLVSVLVGAIRAEAAHSVTPAALLASLNDRIMGRSQGGFTTCMAAHIDAGGRLTLANAGHLPPYLNGEELGIPGSLPLGILATATYQSTTAQLAPGDRLTFVSDGVVEAQSPLKSRSKSSAHSAELFGFDRTRNLSLQPAATIAQAAQSFGQQDDITVVTVEFSGIAVAQQMVK